MGKIKPFRGLVELVRPFYLLCKGDREPFLSALPG